ncbi:pirin [Paenibacillus darwinianus]|uniref:Pirin n=1 Tax=Paenibacillus darwinianus TaxID=1380763 RepID=A0A9W5W679_9BACL|nr:pirin-like bicupin family protein [Paenibacillus darwinianus]EXX84675.1 pirin [Paenibacillus darwinianus]EXX84723.1 pirin [Paenibacillus darwinianus]
MIILDPSESRFRTELEWLSSRLSFPFADHYDPRREAFGPLKVFNNDTIKGNHGFGAHPHREMEIVSVVLAGQLKHEDSLGNTAVTGFGGVQRMSAGTGIIHSEVNPSDEDCTLVQIWIAPSDRLREPSYETSHYDPEALNGRLLPIVSPAGGEGLSSIGQDTTIYMSRLSGGEAVTFRQAAGRRSFLFLFDGRLSVNDGHELTQQGDAVRAENEPELALRAQGGGAFFLLIDLP